jgi:DNA-binding beta-propeller fold protein YncE
VNAVNPPFPQNIALDRGGNIYIGNEAEILKLTPAGQLSALRGNEASHFVGVDSVAVDSAGNLYIIETRKNRVRKMTPRGTITTFAGNGIRGFGGDGGPATLAQLALPQGLALDAAGNLYIADFLGYRVRQVTADGITRTVAGTGIRGYSGDGGPAPSAELNFPSGLALDSSGNLYIAEETTGRVRKVTFAKAPANR